MSRHSQQKFVDRRQDYLFSCFALSKSAGDEFLDSEVTVCFSFELLLKMNRRTLLGKQHIRNVLTTHDNPKQAIEELQESCGLSFQSCKLGLAFLDLLRVRRSVVYQVLLDNLRCKLEGKMKWPHHRHEVIVSLHAFSDRILSASESSLLELLQETFPYIMVPELKSIPVSIIKKLAKVPVKYLKSLANEKFRSSLNVSALLTKYQTEK